MHVDVCDTVRLLAGLFQCNGGKLQEAGAFKYVCVMKAAESLMALKEWHIYLCLDS